MKYAKCFGLGALALALAAATCLASMPTGPVSAKAGSGGVTVKTFVKLSAAGTIVASSAVTDSVVGVCETTASANGMTSYSPPGARTTVTSGEAIAVGDLLTAGTSGYAFVLDTDDASTQRVCGVALTAADDADQDVTILVVASVVEQHQAITGADLNTPDIDGGTADGLVIGGATAAAVTGTTITGTTITDGTVSLAAGTVTGTFANLGIVTTVDINGGTADAVVIGGATAAAVTGTTITGTTITDGTVSLAAGTVTGTFADLGIVTTVDVNGGTIDGVTIGAAAAPTVTNLGSVATCDINGGAIDGVTIGAAAAGAITGTTITGTTITDGTVSLSGGTVTGTFANLGTVTTVDINGGTIDAAVIGGATAAAVTGTTITGTTITDGTVSLAAGTVTGTFADLGIVTTVDVNGGTIDGVTIGAAAAPTVTNLGSVTTCDINGGSIDGAAIGAATPAAGTFSGLTVSGAGTVTTGSGVVSIAGDMQIAATKYILDASVAGTKTRAGTPITIVFLPTTGETLSWVVPTGYDLLVLNAVGWKTAAAGGDAWDLQNNDGTPANIFAQEAIGGSTLADKAMAQFDDLDDTEWEVEATKSLDLVATEDTDDGGADGIIYVYGILKAHD